MGFESLIRDVQDTKDQLGPSDTQSLVFKRFNENIRLLPPTTVVRTQNIGNAFTVGHPTNGIVGTANGVNGSQITIGTSGLGTQSVARIVNSRNTFTEMLRNDEFINTTNTDATFNTTTYTITFDALDEVFESSSIALNSGTVVNAKLMIDETTITGTTPTFEMSANGGTNWETVTLNQTHTFTNTGQDLRYRITNVDAIDSVVITLRDADGVDKPIFLEYNQ